MASNSLIFRFDVELHLAEFRRALEQPVGKNIEDYLRETKEQIEISADAPKTGRFYFRPGGGRYQASARGEAPARRSGTLIDSISEPQVSGFEGEMTIGAFYAEILQDQLERPFVEPALEAARDALGFAQDLT